MDLLRLILLFSILSKCSASEEWEYDIVMCPQQCVCQYSQFSESSIARWIARHSRDSPVESVKVETDEVFDAGDIEIPLEDADTVDKNPMIKYVMCILQSGTDLKDLIGIIPHDVQALIILYNESGKNITVSTSDLKSLEDLTTLEIRGSKDHSFRLVFDTPLPLLKHANFESIELIGSEMLERPKNQIHPSESFDYVPTSERFAYNVSLEAEEEVQILPYDVYLMEIRKLRMASFYGWDSLAVLRIHNCELSELHWEMFNGLSQLQHLSLEHNGITVVPAFAFYGALHIKTLSLARNRIFDLNYRSLAGLLDLKILDLSDNNITRLSELTFPPFPSLEHVDLRSNPINFIFPSTFGVMNNTKTFFMGSDVKALELVTSYPFEPLEFLSTLEILNATTEILHQNIFKGLISLEKLKLKGSIKVIEFDAFAEMGKLLELDLSRCSINELSMDAFMGCKLLEIINLSFNNISYIPSGLFDDQMYINEIYLNNNHLKLLPLNIFDIASLKLLRLTHNPWECTCSMAVWSSKIINQVRGQKVERCIRDFQTAKIISCRLIDNYRRDNKVLPRCTNFRGRSIFYALRKNLRCDFKKEMQNHIHQQTLARRDYNSNLVEVQSKRRKGKIVSPRNSMQHRMEVRNSGLRRNQRKQMRESNTIRHLTQNNNMLYRESHVHDTLGAMDQFDSFNNI